ncbi:MAG: NYN domain-containing protein [Patescibacteria group bacterium]|nr:NYN domain-containing protein [Patescibacteria group bacterium]
MPDTDQIQPRLKVVAQIDYENIVRDALVQGCLVDFEKLAQLCREFGDLLTAYLYVPKHNSYDSWLDNAHQQGFITVAVPLPANPARPKQHENADSIMISHGRNLVEQGLDVLVIVTHDADFLDLANFARNHGKQVVLVAGDKVSRVLVRAVDTILSLPTKSP